MGQNSSIPDQLMHNKVVDNVHLEIVKHTKVFTEIGQLTYDEFQECVRDLNELSRKCIDSQGNQLVFAVKRGTDNSVLWKATVQIACVKVEVLTRKIESYKLLNLKQFLTVFRTFRSHVETLIAVENREERNRTASMIMHEVDTITHTQSPTGSSSLDSGGPESASECCICLDRAPEVLLPCAHTYCCPCIEQWNVNNKFCPICQEELNSTDDTWVLSEIPPSQEVSEQICTELMKLAKENK
ncbi:RING finger protein 141-like [Phlebotomus argentipes]|uniref:RING finger protein 141-like n=1 Tax=Phlebotomus argentipes TaxID=94469 RepID=UPI002892C69C|nr:RING finger protein 141-like [Phlebotomus argentipes]